MTKNKSKKIIKDQDRKRQIVKIVKNQETERKPEMVVKDIESKSNSIFPNNSTADLSTTQKKLKNKKTVSNKVNTFDSLKVISDQSRNKKLKKKQKDLVTNVSKNTDIAQSPNKVKRKMEDEIVDVVLPKKVKLDPKKLKKLNKQLRKRQQFQKQQLRQQDYQPEENSIKTNLSSSHSTQKSEATPKSYNLQKMDVGPPRLKVSTGFNWEDEFSLPNVNKREEISSDESDTEEVKKVEKTQAEIRLEKIAEEKKIYEVERKRLEGSDEPQTADDFDRLVLQSPDSSLVWTRFMAYHLECTEVDKARAVAERALSTISFRDEQEKLNIWVAYLNLENMFGSSDQVEELFERAKTCCDCKKIHERMISIYVRSEKYEEAEQLYNILVKRFHTDKHVWLNFVQFCFRNNRLDTGRKLLQRCFKCLEKKEHIEMISKVAQMEIKFGDGERGRTMYENLVSNYPKRLDLWSVYIDMVRILGDHDGVRKLFERALALKMNAKRMKFIFKKYLDFENQFGSLDRVVEIKEKALKYVEDKGYYDD